MKRSITQRKTISLVILLSCAGLAPGGAAEDANDDMLQTVKVARSGEVASTGRDKTDAVDASLSAKIVLPLLDPNPTLPSVVLSEGHKKTCLKRIGDQFDAVVLPDVNGRAVNLNDELSDRLTVVVFWSQNSVAGYEQFRRIPVDILADFAPHRVKVIAVNVGGTVAETKRVTGSAANKILSLSDENSELFSTLTDALAPRTYVLDSEGHIVWFDIEYSESTRRSLGNALTYFIKQANAEKK